MMFLCLLMITRIPHGSELLARKMLPNSIHIHCMVKLTLTMIYTLNDSFIRCALQCKTCDSHYQNNMMLMINCLQYYGGSDLLVVVRAAMANSSIQGPLGRRLAFQHNVR